MFLSLLYPVKGNPLCVSLLLKRACAPCPGSIRERPAWAWKQGPVQVVSLVAITRLINCRLKKDFDKVIGIINETVATHSFPLSGVCCACFFLVGCWTDPEAPDVNNFSGPGPTLII